MDLIHDYGLQILYAIAGIGLLTWAVWWYKQVARQNRASSRYSIRSSIGGFILSGLSFLPALISLFKDKALTTPVDQLSVIFGMIFLVAAGVVIAITLQKDFASTLTEELSGKLSSIASFAAYHQYFSDESWGKNFIDNMLRLFHESDKSVHVRTEIRQRIDDAILQWLSDVRSDLRDEYPYEQEEERMRRVKSLVCDATSYVYAVTYDEGTYLQDCWAGILGREYLSINQEKARRIRRIFVLGEDVINGTNEEKRLIVDRIVAVHKMAHISFRIICKDKLPLAWTSRNPATSFITCDGHVASESYTLMDKAKASGYVALNDKTTADNLKARFDELDGFEERKLKTKKFSAVLNKEQLQQEQLSDDNQNVKTSPKITE